MMTNRKLTFSQVRCSKLPVPTANNKSNEIEYTDTEVKGLKFAVSKLGQRTFNYRYTFGKKKCFIRIGGFPDLSVKEARIIARSYAAQVSQNIDPKVELSFQKDMLTLSEFIKEMYMPYALQHKLSHRADESKLRLYILPEFGDIRLTDISKYTLQQYITNISRTLSNATANRHRSLLSKIFRMSIDWDLLDVNPCSGIAKLTENPPPARDLSDAEVVKVLTALANDPNKNAAAALSLLFFTGLRLSEVLNARWEFVDIPQKQLYLPHTKAGRSRFVPLNDEALKILQHQEDRDLGSDWVFPGKELTKPLHNPRKAWKRVLTAAGVEYARIHDIRHSFASACVRTGTSLYAVQKLLGHASPITTQRYAHLANDTLRDASSLAVQGYIDST